MQNLRSKLMAISVSRSSSLITYGRPAAIEALESRAKRYALRDETTYPPGFQIRAYILAVLVDLKEDPRFLANPRAAVHQWIVERKELETDGNYPLNRVIKFFKANLKDLPGAP